MLCSNDGETVEESVQSVLALSEFRRLDVVIVDNLSTDESVSVLRRLRDQGLITLIERRCTRGEGRQLGFNSSRGGFVLCHMDCDDVFDAAGLDSLVAQYHARFEGRALMTKKIGTPEASNITIAPREVIEQVGGWRGVNWGEDWDLWARLANAGVYSFMPYPAQDPPHKTIKVRGERYSAPTRAFRVRVSKYADSIRVGRRVFDPGERVSTSQKLALAVARFSVAVSGGTLAPVPDKDFGETSS